MYPYMSNASNSSKDSEKPIKAAEKDNSSVPENDARITKLKKPSLPTVIKILWLQLLTAVTEKQ